MLNKKWDEILKKDMEKDYFKKLGSFVKSEYNGKIVNGKKKIERVK